MSGQVTVTLPDSVLLGAAQWAQRTGKSVEEVLVEILELSLVPLDEAGEPLPSWSNEDVIAAVDTSLPEADDHRLSELLDRQRNNSLTKAESDELVRLMHQYQEGLLRKAEAVHEAVRRGLRQPPLP